MGLLSFCLSRTRRRRAHAARDAGKLTPGSSGALCEADSRCERPISPAELIAASAFLDFGGMFDERWLSEREQEERGARRRK
jgi:hypothetical protein